MSRHDMIQLPAAGTQPPATTPRAPMLTINTDSVASFVTPSRKHRAIEGRSGPSASIPALPDGGRTIPDISRNPKSP
jgi:hypothetical protein